LEIAMVARREMLGGGILGGVLGALAEPEAAQRSGGAGNDLDTERIVRALNDLRTELRNQRVFTELAGVRDAQVTFLRQNGKLPDFIDVGTDIWFTVYDWHIRWQQPLNISRDASGRMTLLLFATQLILRPEVDRNYISLPYDNR
jgi:hypothetical protein